MRDQVFMKHEGSDASANTDNRDELCARISSLVPLVALEGGRIAESFAARLGLHRTDAQALGILLDADKRGAMVTAGSLGRELRLTSGATTFCVNRLEKADFVTRERNPMDHRKIHVALSQRGRDVGIAFERAISEVRNNVMKRFSNAELDVVQRFLTMTANAMFEYSETLAASD